MIKKAAIILGSILIVLALMVGINLFKEAKKWEEPGTPDKTNNNINVMLNRAENWKQIAAGPIVSIEEMEIIDGSTATIPITAELLRQFFGYSDELVNQSSVVYHSTTHYAYENLINSTREDWYNAVYPRIDLIFVTPPSLDELKMAEYNGVELDLTPIAKDGFVFITHKENPVDSLTAEQIQGIYTGEITNWSQVGGADLEIRPYQREPNSGSQTAMEQMVMQDKQLLPPENAKIHMGMGMLIDAVAEYENGPASIGYTYYYYINNLYKNENIKVIKIEGIEPTNKSLISEEYPFSTSYYAVMRGDEPEDSPARKLRDYLISPEGQDIIAMSGYCRAVQFE